MPSKKKSVIAAAQYPIEQLSDWQAYEQKTTHWIEEAADYGAHMVLLPEYASMELTSLFSETIQRSLPQQLRAMQKLYTDFQTFFQSLAKRFRIYIVAGSYPVEIELNKFNNRATLFYPTGQQAYQDKLIMTRFECEQWHISPTQQLNSFSTDLCKFSINICYDCEFPLFFHHQVMTSDVKMLLVPSCTDSLSGYHRVRIAAQARALENQCYVVQAVTVGQADWSIALNENVGAAAIYAPADPMISETGILAIGKLNHPQWVYASLDFEKITEVRRRGQTLNYQDWAYQYEVLSTQKKLSQ